MKALIRLFFICLLVCAGACNRQSDIDEQHVGERISEKQFKTGPPDRIVYQGFYLGMPWKDAERELARLGETQRKVISEGEGMRQIVARCPSIDLEIVLDLTRNQIQEITFGLHAAPLTWEDTYRKPSLEVRKKVQAFAEQYRLPLNFTGQDWSYRHPRDLYSVSIDADGVISLVHYPKVEPSFDDRGGWPGRQ